MDFGRKEILVGFMFFFMFWKSFQGRVRESTRVRPSHGQPTARLPVARFYWVVLPALVETRIARGCPVVGGHWLRPVRPRDGASWVRGGHADACCNRETCREDSATAAANQYTF